MTRLPRIKGKELIRALERAGFTMDRTRGSHVFLKHPDGRGPLQFLFTRVKLSGLVCSVQSCAMWK